MELNPERLDRYSLSYLVYRDLNVAIGYYDPHARVAAAAQLAQQRDDELARYIARKVEEPERAAAAIVDATRLLQRFVLNCRALHARSDAQIRDELYSDIRVRLAAFAGPLAVTAQLDADALQELHTMCRFLRCQQRFSWEMLGVLAFSGAFRRAAAELGEPDWLDFLDALQPLRVTLESIVATHRLPWQALLARPL